MASTIQSRTLFSKEISPTKAIAVQAAIVNVGDRQKIGIDIRYFYKTRTGKDWLPTAKGILMNQVEFEALCELLGIKFEDIKQEIRNFYSGKNEGVPLIDDKPGSTQK